MKRKTYVRYKRRTPKPAVRKQQILRKEAQKRAKYPVRMASYRHSQIHYKRSA